MSFYIMDIGIGRTIQNKKKRGGGGGKYPCAYRAARASAPVPLYTGGVHEPALGPLPGAQGAQPPEALEF